MSPAPDPIAPAIQPWSASAKDTERRLLNGWPLACDFHVAPPSSVLTIRPLLPEAYPISGVTMSTSL
jgi:hypothetical protein